MCTCLDLYCVSLSGNVSSAPAANTSSSAHASSAFPYLSPLSGHTLTVSMSNASD